MAIVCCRWSLVRISASGRSVEFVLEVREGFLGDSAVPRHETEAGSREEVDAIGQGGARRSGRQR